MLKSDYYLCHLQEPKKYDENEICIESGMCGFISNDEKRVKRHHKGHGAMHPISLKSLEALKNYVR